MPRTREKIQEERQQLKRQYGQLFERVSTLLFVHDPVGINFETNVDEYEPEVGTILPRLSSCQSAKEVKQVVYEEFLVWFDSDTVGPEEQYDSIASEIWELWSAQHPTQTMR